MMVFLKSILLGFIGGASQILPLNKNIIFEFLKETNKTYMGNPQFGIDNSTLFFINIGILAALFILFFDKIKSAFSNIKNIDFKKAVKTNTLEFDESEKQNYLLVFLILGSLISAVTSFFVDLSGHGLMPILLCEILCVFLCIIADKQDKRNRNGLYGLILLFALVFCGFSIGISVVAIAIFIARLWDFEKKNIFSFTLNAILISTFFETIVYLVNSVILGFHFAWYFYVLCALFSLVGALTSIKSLKKAISKRNIKICGYFHVVFAFIVIFILMSV